MKKHNFYAFCAVEIRHIPQFIPFIPQFEKIVTKNFKKIVTIFFFLTEYLKKL